MKNLLLLIIIIFSFKIVLAQTLTKKEAINYAEKLNEVEILSEKGMNKLKKEIRQNEENIRKSDILESCSRMFSSESMYRAGIFEYSRIEQEMIEEGYEKYDSQKEFLKLIEKEKPKFDSTKVIPEDFNDKIQDILNNSGESKEWLEEYEKRLKQFEGYKIEENIQGEENIVRAWLLLPNSLQEFEFKLIHNNRSVTGKTLSKTLNDLLKIDLIDSLIYDDLRDLIKKENSLGEGELLNACIQRYKYYKNYDENKAKEISLINELREVGLMSKDNFNKLVNSYQGKELKGEYEILKYCERRLFFDIDTYFKKPEVAYKKIFKDLRKLIPSFDYKNLEIEIVELLRDIEEDEEKVYECKVFFKCNDRKYKIQHYIFLDEIKHEENTTPTELNISLNLKDICNSLNRVLTDINSKQKLYYEGITNNNIHYHDIKNLTWLLLSEKEHDILWKYYEYEFPEKEDYSNTFNIENLKKLIESYKSIGLFNHLTQAEIDDSTEEVLMIPIRSYFDILRQFPNIIKFISDDDIYFEEDKEIVDTQSNNDVKSYPCFSRDFESGLIYLTSEQYEYLSKNQPELFKDPFDE